MNAVLGEAEYSFSRRSAFTFSGSYGLLHFTDAGYIGSHMLNAQAGYDYLLNPKIQIAVLASYGKIDYTGASNSTVDYLANLAFGRKDYWTAGVPSSGGRNKSVSTVLETGTFNFGRGQSILPGWTYERAARESPLRLCEATEVSGVYFGARSNTLNGSLRHQFHAFWSASVNGTML